MANKLIIFRIVIVASLLVGAGSLPNVTAQDRNNATALTWFQFKYQHALKGDWSVTFDNQHRRQDLINFSSQQVLRPGLTYQFKNDLKLTVGPALFWHNIAGNDPNYRFEIRPYTFLEWKQPLGKVTVVHRSRFELRYNRKTAGIEVLDGYNFNYRAGHKMGLSIPLRFFKAQNLSLEIYDEVLINFGKRITVNHLDQNRMYIGVKQKVNAALDLKLGYMYIFLPTSNVERFATQHVMVLGIGLK